MILAATLFIFWFSLSGKTDLFHLGLGLASSIGVAWATRRLWGAQPAWTSVGLRAAAKWPAYLAWLAGQVVLSSLQVALVVLDPRLPISPRLVRFRRKLPHPFAQLTLANSITLTPGTVTVDLEGDEFAVHALTDSNARGVSGSKGEGEIVLRVAKLFQEPSA